MESHFLARASVRARLADTGSMLLPPLLPPLLLVLAMELPSSSLSQIPRNAQRQLDSGINTRTTERAGPTPRVLLLEAKAAATPLALREDPAACPCPICCSCFTADTAAQNMSRRSCWQKE